MYAKSSLCGIDDGEEKAPSFANSVVSLCGADKDGDEKEPSSECLRLQTRSTSHEKQLKYWKRVVSSCLFRFLMNNTISSTTKKIDTSVLIP